MKKESKEGIETAIILADLIARLRRALLRVIE